jgi:3-dehydroquinate dehydratase type I
VTNDRVVVQTLTEPDEPIDPRVHAVELRLDLYPDLDVEAAIARIDKPVVVSIRRIHEGGRWKGNFGRDELFHRARGADYIDLEWMARARGADYIDLEWMADPRQMPRGPRRVVSHHDTTMMLGNLVGMYHSMLRMGDVVKIAVTPPSAVKALTLLDLPRSAIGMGDYGGFTRVLAPWTYCAREPVAPGMPTPGELFDVYRLGRPGLSLRPALLGVVGDPIEHSRSPAFHNPRLEADGFDALYLKYRVWERGLAEFWPEYVARGGQALSVTSPLKVEAAELSTDPAPEVVESGAANTLLSDGRAYNTDVLAFLELIPSGTREALVLGAGGAARAAIAALRRIGAEVRLWARKPYRAEPLGCRFESTPDYAPLVINTTPAAPPPHDFLIDLRYGEGVPEPDRGIGGLAFLEAQAEHQYRLFVEHLRGD